MLARYLGSARRYLVSVWMGAVQRMLASFRSVPCLQCLSEQVRRRPSRGTMFLHVSMAHELSKTSGS
jgi:hypothetical protein